MKDQVFLVLPYRNKNKVQAGTSTQFYKFQKLKQYMNTTLTLALLAIVLSGTVPLITDYFAGQAASAQTSTEKIATVIRTNSSYSAGSFAYDGYGQVSCNKDETLTGGGYYSGFHDALSVYQNRPSLDGTKWLVAARYTPGGPDGGIMLGPAPQFEVYAICMKIMP